MKSVSVRLLSEEDSYYKNTVERLVLHPEFPREKKRPWLMS
jgi:hypothetical protein